LCYSGNLQVENRHGLIVNAELLLTNGRAERDAALGGRWRRFRATATLRWAGDKGFDTQEFVAECRHMNVTQHVAQNTGRAGGSAIDARTTRQAGYAVSQKKRKRIEECFGWLKDITLLRKLKHHGLFRVAWIFTFAAAAYNLVRMRKLKLRGLDSAAEYAVSLIEGKLRTGSPAVASGAWWMNHGMEMDEDFRGDFQAATFRLDKK
jgi:hypothetical protein